MNPSKTKTEQFLDSYGKVLRSYSLPHRLSGQYVLSSCIKHSKNKEIYLLSDRQENLYILKKEKNGRFAQLLQEHQIFEILKDSDLSPFMPECIDYWEESDWCYLLRTYIEGDSLAEYSDKHPSLAKQEIIDFSLEICKLINILHDRKPPIIYRDIKPENFILQKDTHILYLIDFDTARQYIPEKTKDTHLCGTPELAAPEQFGFCQSDIRTDIYGIGITMLYLITGSTAKEGLQDKQIPSRLRKIICRAAAFSPEKRYPSVPALQRDLQKYKKRLSSPFPLRLLAINMIIFSLGLGIGFTAGKLYQTKPPATADKLDNINDTAFSEQSADQLQKAQNSSGSLLSISGAKQVNLWKYQNQVDAIILSYYGADYNSMTEQLETLVSGLYADDALMRVLGEDYSTYEALPPDFWHINDLSTIRVRLAYRNQILRAKLGTYKDYQKNIINILESSVSIVNGDIVPSSLYQYATLTSEERNSYYTFALADLLGYVCDAFDQSDSFSPPMQIE